MKPGDRAPDFSLVATDGTTVALPQGDVVLFFYPKDDTPGCTIEANEFTACYEQFQEKGVAVFGISADDNASHCAFTEKFALTVPLLSDTDMHVTKAYGCLGEWKGEPSVMRKTFVLKDGIITKVYEDVTPEGHAQDVFSLF
ncbi:MAG: peroxiredoxin [Candidatus Woesearchaeota archaeon]|nr:peroxiredoxin [Candidatus Woesearchaeota archaeon]